jgi:phosphohistidine phosphatase
MKTIYLVRHAKSSWSNPGLSDFDRPLNKRGKRDAPFMGELLKEKKIKPELVLSSPAKRAKKTALEVTEKLKYPMKQIIFKEEMYEASDNELLKVIQKLDEEAKSVMLFAHNPGLTQLNNYLSDHYIDNIPTCGVVAIEFNCKWSEIKKNSGKFLFFEYPKKYLE